jgi:DNA-binding PadR family transcriptional regulator
MIDLTKKEEILLLSIWRSNENAYGVLIQRKIKKLTGKEWNYGTLYAMLDQLVKKGMLEKIEGEPIPERGGRRKYYYKISQDGIDALQESFELHKALWKGIEGFALNGKP